MKLLPRILSPLRELLFRLEKYVAGISLLGLLLLSLFQILARDLFNTGYPSIEILIRHLVLIVIFMGAAMAVDEYKHIKLDIANAFLRRAAKWYMFRIVFFLAAIISAVFCFYSSLFWLDEWHYIPVNEKWAVPLLSVMPIGFALLAIHFFIAALIGLPRGDESS
ncbi:MAG: TRAP transporter small permease subunit [Gammaproteobacteria bacterium]|nr:TRAP transporter small permease subunit [Gammaproteobacteria bacterium]